jgi:serine/threonine protein kinase
MICNCCQTVNPDWGLVCVACASPLPSPKQSVTQTRTPSTSPQDDTAAAPSMSQTMFAGRYEVLELLGRGGMGTVYKAFDHKLSRVMALKILRPELARRGEVLERFQREFLAARQIRHPNVIRLFELKTAEGLKFMSMQYVEGRSLKALLKGYGKFPPDKAALLVRQICDGLAAAHASNVVHRDLNPRNVMVDRHGGVIILDFGVARALDLPALTPPGGLIGTAEYMSPEQAVGEKVDARSDLYAVGLILYELLVGERLHKSLTIGNLLELFRDRLTVPIEWSASALPAMGHIVEKCLRFDRNERYQSAREIICELDAWLGYHRC